MKKEERILNVIDKVDEKYIEEADPEIKIRKKAFSWSKWGILVASFACILMIGSYVYQNSIPSTPTLPPQQDNNVISDLPADKNLNIDSTSPESNVTISMHVNEIDTPISSDMDVEYNDYNELSTQEWNSILDNFEKAVGMTYATFTAKISDIWELENFYSISTRGNIDGQYQLHDYVFEYQTENGGNVKISLCPYESPLRDWFVDGNTAEPSTINDMEFIVYRYDNTFVAQLYFQNVHYDITANDITLADFEDLLLKVLDVQ